jgi:large subunit ribosomal protein L18
MKGAHAYVPIYRRRRSGATDYKARRKAISSRGTLLAVRISGKNVSAQFLKPTVSGDLVLASAHSHALRKLGWNGSLKSVPACYLLGLWAGKTAKAKGIETAYLYNGLAPFVKGARISAFVKGVADGGVHIPFSEDVVPSEDRLKGENIANYAAELAKQDKQVYERRFSGLLKLGFKPEDYAQNYAKTKDAIMGAAQ